MLSWLVDSWAQRIQVSARGFCHVVQKECLTPRCALLTLILQFQSVDAPSVKQSAKLLGMLFVEPIMRNQKVLERFFRVRGNNTKGCWSGQSNMASGTGRSRLGVERTMEHAHLPDQH